MQISNFKFKIFLFLPLLTLVGCAHVPAEGVKKASPMPTIKELTESIMPKVRYKEIVDPAGYVNTEKITMAELIGKKVVLLDFVTYSCINCIRTFPYLNAWYDKYKDQGLEIVGIHTPEFAFEKKRENVIKAAAEYGLKFPLVLDNNYATWNAYGNRYWPRKYLIDIHGNIIYDHIGEGAYEETEEKIQAALAERAQFLGEEMAAKKDTVKPETETVVAGGVRSPEIYFGSDRNQYLGTGQPGRAGTFNFALTGPEKIRANTLYLLGEWEITPEYARSLSDEARVIFRYRARRVNVVAGADQPKSIAIRRDEGPVGQAGGEHVKDNQALVEDHDLYEIIDDPAGYGEHTVEIKTPAGVRFYTFTFG